MPGSNGGYGNGRPRFTPEERTAILAAYDAGETVRAIARRHGCCPEAVNYHLRATMRLIRKRDRHDHEKPSRPDHPCDRCGIDTTEPDLCFDCTEILLEIGGPGA